MDDLLNELAPPAQNPEERARRRRLVAAVGIAGLSLVTVGSLTSGALFTDQKDLTANSFTAGTVILGLNPATALFNATLMAPGDNVYAPLTVSNAGSLALRYSATATATDPDTKGIRTQIAFTVYSGVTAANCNAAGTAAATVVSPAAAVGVGTATIFGSPTQGAQAGDRALSAATNEVLCFKANLPLATTNAYQGATTTVTFRFDAEQTANN